MSNLNSAHAKSLFRVLSSAGMDCSELRAANPYNSEFSDTPKGRHIRMILESASPQLAVELKREVGHRDTQPSLAMAAAMADNTDPTTLTGKLQAEYIAANPQLVQEQQQKQEADTIAWLEAQTEKAARKREGDRQYDQRLAREKAQREAAEQRAAEGRALEQRIAAKQQQIRDAGRIAMGNAVIPN